MKSENKIFSELSPDCLHNEEAAYAYVEKHVWPDGPICPHCKGQDRISKMNGKSTRIGLYKCYRCRKPFTVKIGTIFESSHIPLHLWLQAMFLMASSKKGISSLQLERTLGLTYKSAWFMSHRIREAMRSGELAVPFGGGGGSVEVDETFIGRGPGMEVKRAYHHKMKVLALVDRSSRQVKSVVVDDLKPTTIAPILNQNMAAEAKLLTDESTIYNKIGKNYAAHDRVNHNKGEYVSYSNPEVHTNTIEGYFSIFKRGMKGIYQHCGKQHLHRYCAEFDFRYNYRIALGVDDHARALVMLKSVSGKRLTYRAIGPKRDQADTKA